MTIRTRTLTVAAVAAITTGLVVTAAAPASADITNTESTAKSRCKKDGFDEEASIEKKRSMSRTDGPGESTDPGIGTLYVVRVSGDDGTRHCAIAIKGSKPDGEDGVPDYDYMTVTIGSDADFDWNGVTGDRKEIIGPVYWNGEWDVAQGTLTEGSKHYEALIKL